MGIRRAVRGDVGGIVIMSSRLFAEDGGVRDPNINILWPEMEGKEYFGAIVSDESSLCLVYEEDGRVIGYLVGRSHSGGSMRKTGIVELESMYIEEEWRSRGIGTALVGEFLKWGEGRGVEVATVTAYAENERALGFYRRHGFVPKSITLERREVR